MPSTIVAEKGSREYLVLAPEILLNKAHFVLQAMEKHEKSFGSRRLLRHFWIENMR